MSDAIASKLPYYRLFILGAGFSKPAGLPLANELLELVRTNIRGGSLEDEIKEWAVLYPGQPLDLERVLGYSHRKYHLHLLGSDEHFEHGSLTIVNTRRHIQQLLINATPSIAPYLYRKFAKHLSPYDVVLTFNYDTLLEQVLDDIDKLYSLTPERWLTRDTDSSGSEYRYIDLLKLHGSIDWYDRFFHDDIMRYYDEEWSDLDMPDEDPLFGANPSIPTEHLARGTVEKGFGDELLRRVWRVPNHVKHFPNIPQVGRYWDAVPFMLPLAYDKLLGYDPIVALWSDLGRTFDVFSNIVVVGYSMPEHDSHAYEALGQLLTEYQNGGHKTRWGQRRVPIQVITLAETTQEALNGMPFLRRSGARVWHDGFTTASLDWIDWGDGDTLRDE